MGNVRLKNIQFPGLDNTYTIPDEAPAYSTSGTYAVGDMVIYDGKLYKCTTAIPTAEAWTAAHWSETKMGNEVSELKTALNLMFDKEDIAVYATATGGYIAGTNGIWKSSSSFNVKKYAVTAGDILYLDIAFPYQSSGGVFQFQNNATIPSSSPNSYIVGGTYTSAYKGNMTVPTGATYLMVAIKANETDSNVIQKLVPKTDAVASDIAILEEANPQPETPYSIYGSSWSGTVNGKVVTKNKNEFSFGTYNSGGYRYFSMLSDQLYVSTGNDITSISADAFTLQNRLEKHATYELIVISSNIVAGCGYIGIYDKQGNLLSERLTPSTANTIYKTTFVNDDAPKALLAQRSGTAQLGTATVSIFLNKIDPEWIYGDTNQKRIRAGRWLHDEGTPVSFVHFSDLHGDGRELGRILAFSDINKSVISDVIATGDMCRASVESDFTFWSDRNVSKVLMALGNHEYYTSSDDHTKYTIATVIQKWIGDYSSNWGVTITSGNSYYYKDYAESVRLIVLDCNLTAAEGGTDQKTWLATTLADAATNNLAVVIATHYVYLGTSKTYDVIESNFTDSYITEDFESIYDWSPTGYADTVQTFINDGGTFVCWLTGHRHKDILTTPTDYPNQLIVTICQASPDRTYPSTITTGDLERTTDTATADAFNYVTIDTVNHCLKVARIGADLNTFMIPRETFCYNYSTHQFIN